MEKSAFQHVDYGFDNQVKTAKNLIVDICINVLVNIMAIMRSLYILAFLRWKGIKEKRARFALSSVMIYFLIQILLETFIG